MTLAATGSTLRIADGRASTEVEVRLSAFGDGETLSALEAETATRAVLSTIQDSVTEALTTPWPALEAFPHAVVRDGTLTAWFGTEDDPVLRFGAIGEGSR